MEISSVKGMVLHHWSKLKLEKNETNDTDTLIPYFSQDKHKLTYVYAKTAGQDENVRTQQYHEL